MPKLRRDYLNVVLGKLLLPRCSSLWKLRERRPALRLLSGGVYPVSLYSLVSLLTLAAMLVLAVRISLSLFGVTQ